MQFTLWPYLRCMFGLLHSSSHQTLSEKGDMPKFFSLLLEWIPKKKKFVSNELYTWTFLYKNLGNVINQLHNQDRFTHFSSTEKKKLLDN